MIQANVVENYPEVYEMKKNSIIAVVLSIVIFSLPVLARSAETADIKVDIRQFDLAVMQQMAGADWQTDPNSGANIIKKDAEEMEKRWNTPSTGDYSSSSSSYGGSDDIEWEYVLIAAGCAALLVWGVMALAGGMADAADKI